MSDRRVVMGMFLLVMLVSAFASGATLRYALVIGNNRGVDQDGKQPFPPLTHAEDEARRLRDKLTGLCNFDPDPARTALLTGATRTEVLAAFDRLVGQMEADRQAFGEARTLFGLFFTGHGLSGELLLNDGPLTADELGDLIRRVGADFTVGVFDSCYSGSLDPETLASKGLELTPGFNPFRELPQEILSAEGSVWFASSGPGQVSYEDHKLGGVFTHFFIEGLERAERVGPGITLDRIWDYARVHTIDFTSARAKLQRPQQLVARLKSDGPLYFSFPGRRTATLVLGKAVSGQLLLSYADGQLTETIQKATGEEREIAVYPGRAWLSFIEGGKEQVRKEIALADGDRLVLRAAPDPLPAATLGSARQTLWEKGAGPETISAVAIRPGVTALLGVAYQLDASAEAYLSPRHQVGLALRLDRGGLILGARLGYGYGAEDLGGWSYTLDAVVGGLYAGYGLDLGRLRLGLVGELGLGYLWQYFYEGGERSGFLFQLGARPGLLIPISYGLALEVFLRGGLVYAPGAGRTAGNLWRGFGGGGVGVLMQF